MTIGHASCRWTDPIELLPYFKAVIPGSVSEYQDMSHPLRMSEGSSSIGSVYPHEACPIVNFTAVRNTEAQWAPNEITMSSW